MDIVNPGIIVDENFLMKNPVWGTIANKTSTSSPFPSVFCPCNSENPADWISAPDCTGQNVTYNEPFGGNYCPDGGHMNYFPITYEANVCWGDRSGWDGDYNFRMKRRDRALETAGWEGLMLQTEFDSDETVDDWDDTETWWNAFHHDKVDESDEAAREAIDGKFAIVIGMAGIDLEHGCHIELHPVYAMFVHIKDDPNNDHWAFFVRNWGNQGYCGNNQIYYRNFLVGENVIRVKIPHENATRTTITSNIKSVSDANKKVAVFAEDVPDGLLLTFQLDVPEEHTTVVGDINIQWSNPEKTMQPRDDADPSICSGLGVHIFPEASEGAERRMSKLDSTSKKDLMKKVNEQFRKKQPINSIVISKKPFNIERPSPNKIKKINYSKMFYQVQDTLAYKKKNERMLFIKEYFKSKASK